MYMDLLEVVSVVPVLAAFQPHGVGRRASQELQQS